MTRDQLLDRLSQLATDATIADQHLLGGALLLVLRLTRLPYRVKQRLLNAVSDLVTPIADLHGEVTR